MTPFRVLRIPAGQTQDADGRAFGDDWVILDMGTDEDGASVWVTTDQLHASDVGDLCGDLSPLAVAGLLVDALNARATAEEEARLAGARSPEGRAVIAAREQARAEDAEDFAGQLADFDFVMSVAPHLCPCEAMSWAMSDPENRDSLRDLPTRAERESGAPGRCYCSPTRVPPLPDSSADWDEPL